MLTKIENLAGNDSALAEEIESLKRQPAGLSRADACHFSKPTIGKPLKRHGKAPRSRGAGLAESLASSQNRINICEFK
jgi:hypothetical protein